MTGNEAKESEREREIWGERESNVVEGENSVGHMRRWRGLI